MWLEAVFGSEYTQGASSRVLKVKYQSNSFAHWHMSLRRRIILYLQKTGHYCCRLHEFVLGDTNLSVMWLTLTPNLHHRRFEQGLLKALYALGPYPASYFQRGFNEGRTSSRTGAAPRGMHGHAAEPPSNLSISPLLAQINSVLALISICCERALTSTDFHVMSKPSQFLEMMLGERSSIRWIFMVAVLTVFPIVVAWLLSGVMKQ